jgi:hypothetical protein
LISFNKLSDEMRYVSLCLNEMLGASLRLAPAGPRLRASKIAPGDFVRKNLAANLERSPLTHSGGYGPAGDRSTLFARFPLSFIPFMQYAG